MHYGNWMVTAALGLSLAAGPAAADSTARGSAHLSAASGVVALGAAGIATGSAQLVIASIETAGDGVTVIANGASDASRASIQLSSEATGALSLAVGAVITVSAETAGSLLVHAGKVIAFVPNELGRALLHHALVGSGS